MSMRYTEVFCRLHFSEICYVYVTTRQQVLQALQQKQHWISPNKNSILTKNKLDYLFLSPFYVSYYMNTNGPNPKSKRIKRHNALVSTGREMENTVTGQHIPPNIFPHFYQTTKTNISFLHSLIPKNRKKVCNVKCPGLTHNMTILRRKNGWVSIGASQGKNNKGDATEECPCLLAFFIWRSIV